MISTPCLTPIMADAKDPPVGLAGREHHRDDRSEIYAKNPKNAP